jgi:catechol 2,3-dioxygenase
MGGAWKRSDEIDVFTGGERMTTTGSERSEAVPADQVIPPSRLHHVVVKTRRLQEMKEFYANLIGTKEVATFAFPGDLSASFVSYDSAQHRLAFFSSSAFEGENEPGRAGLHHVAFEYDTLEDLVHTYKRLKKQGVEPVWMTDHGPTISFYYYDPDRNLAELQLDNFGEDGRSKDFFATMQSDPRYKHEGWDIDPDRLIEAMEAGVSHWEIHELAWAGKLAPEVRVGPPGLRARPSEPQQ